MLHKIYDFFGWERDKNLEEKEEENFEFIDKVLEQNAKILSENEDLVNKIADMKEEQKIPPLKIELRATRKKRPWCWGPLMMLMAFIQAILLASGKQKTARRHLIGLLKELEYHYGFRFSAIEEGEDEDERKG